jgi:hypothetical protein
MLIDEGKARSQPLAKNILRTFVERRVKQGTERSLVQLAREKVQPRLKSCALDGPVRRHELSQGIAIPDVLGDRGGLEQDAAVVEHERRQVAERVYRSVVSAIRHLLAGFIDFHCDKSKTALEQGNMGHQRYRARRVVQFHDGIVFPLLRCRRQK